MAIKTIALLTAMWACRATKKPLNQDQLNDIIGTTGWPKVDDVRAYMSALKDVIDWDLPVEQPGHTHYPGPPGDPTQRGDLSDCHNWGDESYKASQGPLAFYAAAEARWDVLELLHEFGADLNTLFKRSYEPYASAPISRICPHQVTIYHHDVRDVLKTAIVLIKHGADVDRYSGSRLLSEWTDRGTPAIDILRSFAGKGADAWDPSQGGFVGTCLSRERAQGYVHFDDVTDENGERLLEKCLMLAEARCRTEREAHKQQLMYELVLREGCEGLELPGATSHFTRFDHASWPKLPCGGHKPAHEHTNEATIP